MQLLLFSDGQSAHTATQERGRRGEKRQENGKNGNEVQTYIYMYMYKCSCACTSTCTCTCVWEKVFLKFLTSCSCSAVNRLCSSAS